MLAHVFFDAIYHLKKTAEKMKISNDLDDLDSSDSDVLKIHECESCVLSKAHKIIS